MESKNNPHIGGGGNVPSPTYKIKKVIIIFSAYDFTYGPDENNYESAYEHGLMLCDYSDLSQNETAAFANNAEILETRITRRVDPIFYGVNRHSEPLTFSLVFGSDRALDRFELESISLWLDSGRYGWLTIDEPTLEDKAFYCICTELEPISHGWLTVAFHATFQCSTPYAHSLPWEYEYNLSGSQQILFRNEGSTREHLRPDITLEGVSGTFSIVNETDNNREFKLTGIPVGATKIYINNNAGIIVDDKKSYNLYDGFNGNFLRLRQGDNLLRVTGSGKMTLSGRFMHNLAA